ncbi:sugar transferase [Candidatus Nomurabacteria bacterium]|nr:sugar transferase [Candidatus Nomurabacteria bacterium]
MKKADFVLNLLLVPFDFVLLFAAGLSAYFLRFSETVASRYPVFFEIPLETYFSLLWKVAILGIIIFAFSGFYSMQSKSLIKEIPRVFTGVSFLVVFLILVIFVQREVFSSRFIIILAWLLAIIYLILLRVILTLIKNYLFKKSWGLAKVIILGDKKSREDLVTEYKNNHRWGFKIVGLANSLKDLENSEELKKIIETKKIDYIIQTDSTISKDEALDLLTFCQENQISLKYVANLFQAQSLHLNLSSVAGLPVVEIQGTPLDGWGKVVKRIFDLMISFVLLVILLPIFIILAILIKLESKGSIFVGLERVGKKGEMFKIYKFRSMISGAHELKKEILAYNERKDGPLFKMKNDPRITKFGRYLRKFSLDELPQLFNVLKGEMSLVGPRPHEPEEVSQYQRGYKKLLSIKPGITGMAQVSGRSDLLFSEEAKLDIFYIENWSLLLDLVIFLKTPWVVFKKKAY